MSNEQLSADEMDCLLNGVPAGESPRKQISDSAGTDTLPLQLAESMSDLQRRNFQSVHEVLADRAANSWSQKLRGKIDVRVTKVVESKFGEFSFSLDNPTCFLTLDVAPLAGHVCLEIHPTILFPMIDRLLGGGKKAGPIVRRPLTDIERRLLGRLVAIFFDEFRVAWRPYAILSPEIGKIESNPKLSRCVPAADSVEAIEFEVSMPFARGPIRMAYPSASLAALHVHLNGENDRPFGAADNAENEMAQVRVVIAERTLEPNDSEHNLQVGDLVDTGVAIGGFAELHVNGEPAFVGQVGQHQGMKAFRIEDVVEQRRAG